MIFRQFCTDDEQISYLLADPVTRYAALLDPNARATVRYFEVIEGLDLKLVYVIETHAHESHLSAAPVIRAKTGARVVAHAAAGLTCADMTVAGEDSLFVGEESIQVLATPGHSACSLSFLWRDRLFSGHTLLTGRTGSCQRRDADAGLLFDSVTERLLRLPEETLVCPGRVVGQRRISCIGQERAANADLQPPADRERFVKRKRLETLYSQARVTGELAANRRCVTTG